MEYQDQELTCRDCKRGFSFTAGEQKFFSERQFTPPVRCKQCRDTRKASAPPREQQQEPLVQRVAERYAPQPREQRTPRYDQQDWPDARPTKFDRYASKRKKRRHERDEDDEW